MTNKHHIRPIDLQAQYMAYKNEIDEAIANVLNTSAYIGGEDITQLEQELASTCSAEHAICCSSGTDALLLALMAAGIKAGDEVITTSFSFVATLETIALLGAIPVAVDIDKSTALLDASKIEEVITQKTRAIIPVSLFGQVCDMDSINTIAKKHNLLVIEDAAQSFGSQYKDRFSCNLSEYACSSFYPAKPLGCYGDGGVVFTNSESAMKKIRILLNHGQDAKYSYTEIGINGRLDTIQAAILRVKLRHYAKEIAQRQKIACFYLKGLIGTSLTPVKVLEPSGCTFSQFSVYARARERERIRESLAKVGVPTAIYYPKPLHMHTAYASLCRHGDLSHTEEAAQCIFSIPLHPFMREQEYEYVIEQIHKVTPA